MATEPDSPKRSVARAGAVLVESGMVVRLGSGSTAALMVRCLSERISAEALKVTGVATSEATAHLARELGIPLSRLDDVDALDINLDGADEVDLKFQMIKGRGGYAARGNQPKR